MLNHTAQITADSYLSSDNIRIPTGNSESIELKCYPPYLFRCHVAPVPLFVGEIVPVKDTPAFDFTVAKEFGRDIKRTPNDAYDNNYCITNPGDITKLQARYVKTAKIDHFVTNNLCIH